MSAGFSFEVICWIVKYFFINFSYEYVTGMSRWRDLDEILFWVIMLMDAWLSPYSVIGYWHICLMSLLNRKWENDSILLIVLYKARSSASVESEAIDVWMFVVYKIFTPLNNPQFDCIDLLCGIIFRKDESEKKTRCGDK